MDIGFAGLGRMGGNMVRRLARAGIRVAGYDPDPSVRETLASEGVIDEAVAQGVPAHVLSLALMARFASQGRAGYAWRLMPRTRHAFGGHARVARTPPVEPR